jgi:hypothetical protein
MSLRTKLSPMGGKSGKKYKAYIVTRSGNSYTYYDVADYGFSANIDPETTFATNDGIFTYGSNYISLNGKLVTAGNTSTYSSPILDNCTMISGMHCISNKKLYSLNNTTATLVNVSGDCTKVTGYYFSGNQGFVIAIIDGYIYYAKSNSASTFAIASGFRDGWTDISGYPMLGTQCFLGIKNNTAYQIAFNGTTYYTNSAYYINNAEKIYGVSSFNTSSPSSPTYYGVVKTTDGSWYRLGGSYKNQISLAGKTIEKISVNGCPVNTPASTDYDLAITSGGYLHQLSNMSRVGTYSQWEYISGCYGIMNGKLYFIASSSYSSYPVSVITDKCIKVCTMSLGNSARALVICEK